MANRTGGNCQARYSRIAAIGQLLDTVDLVGVELPVVSVFIKRSSRPCHTTCRRADTGGNPRANEVFKHEGQVPRELVDLVRRKCRSAGAGSATYAASQCVASRLLAAPMSRSEATI
jgi:hypothetical protein